MNKQKLIDKAVEQFKGKWPSISQCQATMAVPGFDFADFEVYAIYYFNERISKEEFNKRARELGWINGFKWGVEYPTNGKKPDLPDDVVIDIKCESGSNRWLGHTDQKVCDTCWEKKDGWEVPASQFKIIDQRYKPVDQMSKSEHEMSKECLNSDWYCYEQHKAIALPPVGVECEVCNSENLIYGHGEKGEIVAHVEDTAVLRMSYGLGCFSSQYLRPLDWKTRAKELEKKRVVDAALDEILSDRDVFSVEFDHWCAEKQPSGDADSINRQWSNSYEYRECISDMRYTLNLAYDKGFLKLPENK